MKQVSVRSSVLSIMLTLVTLMAASLLISQYYFSEKLARESTSATFNLIAKNTVSHINKGVVNTHNILAALRKNPEFHEPITFESKHPSFSKLIQVLNIRKTLYSIYFAQPNGSFYEIINMRANPQLYQDYKAPKKTAWIIVTSIDNQQQLTFLNAGLELINKKSIVTKYNPLNRLWYKDAIASDGIIRTLPYLFFNTNSAGVTYATKLENNGGVLALDTLIGQLNHVLAEQKTDENSEVFLVNSNGKKLASSNFISKTTTEQITSQTEEQTILFTPKERAYIQNHSTLLVSNEDDWEPFDFVLSGEPRGYSIDLLNLLSLKSGLRFQFINGLDWTDILSSFQSQNLDIVHSIYKEDEREKIGAFTNPMYSFKNYFVVPKDSEDIETFDELSGKTVIVLKDWSIHKFIQEKYPNISLLVVDNVDDAFIALSKGKADAMIDSKESFLYTTKKLHFNNLKLSSWTKEFDNNELNSIYMLVQNNNPLLLSIINKTLNSLKPSELRGLEDKWFYSENHFGSVDAPLLKKVLNKETEQIIKYSTEKNDYFAIIKPTTAEGIYLAIKMDSNILLKPYLDNIKYSLFIAFILLLIAFPATYFSSGLIVKPIKELVLENNKVKNRQYKDIENIDTHITEFHDLSTSLVDMSYSIQDYEKKQEELLDSLIKLIAEAIDAKSPYTGGHCERVPEVAQLLLDEASNCEEGIFKDFSFTTKEELREFEIGAWLHDCGKVSTPEFVVDKATKLETIYNRIHEVRMRFEVLWRDAEIAHLSGAISQEELIKKHEILQSDYEFIANTNAGGEFMDGEKKKRVQQIADQEWQRNFNDRIGLGEPEIMRYTESSSNELPVIEKLLNDKPEHIVVRDHFDTDSYEKNGFKLEVPEHLYNFGEVYNLMIEKGTLSPEERYKINEHVILSIKMLEKIPFPEHLKNIPEYAGTHHETLIGTGYPRKLVKDELSIPARVMAIADIFEALTASDRPYKKAKTLSASIKIMSFMVKDQHIDEDLFKLFLDSGVYKVYADKYLEPSQIDDVNIDDYLS